MTRPALALAIAVAAGAAGCDDAVPGSVLAGPRVIAVIADPPVIAVDGAASLTAVAAVDGVPAIVDAAAWRACSPAAVIVDPIRDCLGDVALPLPSDGRGGAILDAEAIVAAFGDAGALPPGTLDDPCGRAVVPVVIVVDAELAGARLVATKQVRIGPAPPPRTNPVLAQVVADGAALADGAIVAPDATIEVTADLALDALDRVCGEGADPLELESVEVSVFAGGGGTVSPGSFGIDHAPDGTSTAGTVEVVAPDEPGPLPLWLVAIDQDGGVAVAFRSLVVAAP